MASNSLSTGSLHRGRKSTRKNKPMTWGRVRSHFDISNLAKETVEAVVDGDTQEIWPKSASWFLGPKAENSRLLRELVTSAVDHHVEFRKYKYFPLDPEYVTPYIKDQNSYKEAEETIKKELEELSSRLNNSVPFFNFRSQGHMLWDTTIASNIGYIAALFYNQNNVASMASGVTLQLEREVAKELCEMVGYNVAEDEKSHTTARPISWGHLPNGGTVANLEAMWAARCLKTNGLTFKMMLDAKADKLGIKKVYEKVTFKNLQGEDVLLKNASVWELLNIPIDEAIDLFDSLLKSVKMSFPTDNKDKNFDNLFKCVKNFTLEQVGALGFFKELKKEYKKENMEPSLGKWFTPGTRHYSWDKGANILGLGRNNLVKVPVDLHCRMDLVILRKELKECLDKKIPVIGVTVVFGSTQEGAVDDLHQILEIRREFEAKGLTFYIHIDGAWGGYFASCLVKKESQIRMRTSTYENRAKPETPKNVRKAKANCQFLEAKLSEHFIKQLVCINQANSITLDPHKSGFCPYPAGGLLYKNGNIRKFLAQNAAYVSHGTGKNDEINLYGIDGSKPGAASAGVWLSHKVIGLHAEGYGLLLQQCTFSAGVMYAVWCSMERPQDPFTIVPGIPIKEKFKHWTKSKIRSEIIDAENADLHHNVDALQFIKENGPDTLINSLSLNTRTWNKKTNTWDNNISVEKQKDFINKFYKRCSHSYEKPSMVDRGIQVILNSTVWTKNANGGAYKYMKEALGLDEKDDESIGVIINTSMSPWLRAQKTCKRIGLIIRNELYNAYGAIHDKPENLKLVSPNLTDSPKWEGSIFAELETSFSNPSLCYHAIGRFVFDPADVGKIKHLASNKLRAPMRIVTREKMTVFDLMTGGDEEHHINQEPTLERKPTMRNKVAMENVKDKIEFYSDYDLRFQDIAMPEVPVTVYYEGKDGQRLGAVDTKMKLGRVLRYQHLGRDFVDEDDYPPSQEYFLYADNQTAYLSHCPNRWPDFQQQVQLDQIPVSQAGSSEGEIRQSSALFQEAMKRGVVVYLPQVETGGRPLMSRSKFRDVCRDPLQNHFYNALAWSDQGAFTGDMRPITLKFYEVGKRWFNGKKINADYSQSDFPHLYKQMEENWKDRREDDSDFGLDSDSD